MGELRGAYIIGKAATLNGRIGDVIIPNVVYDEHSITPILFSNVFTAEDVVPYLVYGDVLDNQRAIAVRGTFLQNRTYMEAFLRRGYTDVEMEVGPVPFGALRIYPPAAVSRRTKSSISIACPSRSASCTTLRIRR